MAGEVKEVAMDWVGGLRFRGGEAGRPPILVDGDGEEAPGPMAGLLAMLASCTGADVVSILEKMRALPARFRVEVRGTRREDHPRRYTHAHLVFLLEGGDAEEGKARRAVELSLEKYCSVLHSLRPDIEVTHELRLSAG
ncbi:MAG TPA: OsmC family protein [Gemmatimonadales bacterium]|nr:OsmC family protein [Gemmatimonadales bacterium]